MKILFMLLSVSAKCVIANYNLAFALEKFLINSGKPHVEYFSCNLNQHATFLMAKHLSTKFFIQFHSSAESYQHINVTFIESEIKPFFVVEANCNDLTNDLVINANRNNMFRTPFTWAFLNVETEAKESIYTILENQEINIWVDSNVNIIENYDEQDDVLYVKKLYKVKPNNKSLIVENIIIDDNKQDNNYMRNNALRRKNLYGSEMFMSSVVVSNNTYKNFNDRREKYMDMYTKATYILFQHMTDFLNSSGSYYFEKEWGYKDPNGKYNGMMGKVYSGQADIGGTSVFMNKERIGISTFIGRMHTDIIKFVFRQPKLSDIRNLFILPFTSSVWYLLIALIIVMVLFFYIALKWNNYKQGNTDEQIHHHLLDSIDIVFAALSQQASTILPTDMIGCIITFVLYLTYSVVFVFYSANIVSLLQSSSRKINTLEDLYKSSFEYSKIFYMQAYYDSFAPFYPKLQKAIYYEKMQNKSFVNFYDAVNAIRTTNLAFATDKYQLYAIIEDVFTDPEKCALDEMKYIPESSDLYIPVHKTTPYLELMKLAWALMNENGLRARILSMYITNRPKCHSLGPFESAQFQACYPLVIGFVFGVCLSFIILIVELIWHKINEKLTRTENAKNNDLVYIYPFCN